MQILTIDVGTGTQDIYLYRSGLSIENGYKMVMPSPTMRIREQIQAATQRQQGILLTGVTMGGGPCHWAAEAHLRAGLPLFATLEAAQTFNDDLSWVENEMGITIVSEDEAKRLDDFQHIELFDFKYPPIAEAFENLGVSLNPQAIGVAVFDHGAAPPGESDRRFRFEYLRRRIAAENSLSAFAFLAEDIPASMTRMQAVVKSAGPLDCPLVVMDTAPAAVLGATLDENVAAHSRLMVVNIGNFHTLAFRLGPTGIEGVFEHHTGEIDLPRLETMLRAFARGDLQNEDVYDDHGHGALIINDQPLPLSAGDNPIVVSGPRRSFMRKSKLRMYFAAPFGDMMISGCFGLLSAMADRVPDIASVIENALSADTSDTTPWDV
ncbi:MAG: DUF1786 domain-containing protein [Anaerolineales bacterium]|jgi:uncharacterized protein (DUF1786 family)